MMATGVRVWVWRAGPGLLVCLVAGCAVVPAGDVPAEGAGGACEANGCGPGGVAEAIVPEECVVSCASLCAGPSLVLPDWVQIVLLAHPCRELVALAGTVVSFSPSCNGHDDCYSNCGERGVCDLAFLERLLASCDEAIEGDGYFEVCQRATCHDKARAYYRFVDLFGEGSWERACERCGPGGAMKVAGGGGEAVRRSDEEVALLLGGEAGRGLLELAGKSPDGDADGLPDAWEVAVGLDPGDPWDSGADYDHDGLTHLAEFLWETDPFAGDSGVVVRGVE